MASVELDPLFLKAINLLRSKHPDSAKHLDTLVKEYRLKTYGSTNSKKNVDENIVKSANTVDSIKQSSSKLSPSPTNINIKEKKLSVSPVTSIEKLVEITNLTDEKSNDGIKEEEATIEEITVGSSLEQPARKKQRLHSKISMSETSPISDSEANDNIPIDEIIEMDFDGPMCKVCHLNKRSEDENLLVECSECHSHYHQTCHKPNVSTKDLNDPRLIWYCSRCTKKMNKEMAAQQQQQQQQQQSSSNNNGKSSTEAPVKVVSNPFQQAKPFRRNITTNDSTKVSNDTTNKNSASSSSSSSDPVISTAKESTSREGSPSSKQRPHDVAVNSMKRLELVKKRANKMQQLLKQSRK